VPPATEESSVTAPEEPGHLHRLHAVSIGINEAILRIPQERRLYEEACRIAVEQGGLRMVWVGLVDESGSAALKVAARWGQDDGYLDAIAVHTSAQQHQGLGPGGEAFRTGKPAVCNDIAGDGQFFASQKEALARGYRSCAAFPIKLSGRPIGIFVAYSGSPSYFGPEELKLLWALTENFSFALDARRKDLQRQETEQALRASAALLGMASRLGRIGAWAVEVPSLSVTWSDELCAIHEVPRGFQPSFAQGLVCWAPEHQDIVEGVFTACMRDGTPFDLEFDLITRTGRRVHGRSIGEAVRDASGAICRVQGAFQDITERRQAEGETRQLADQLVTTLESVTDAFITVDRNWRFTYVNREAERLLRRPRSELLGANVWREFPDAKGGVFEEAYKRAVREKCTVELVAFYAPLQVWLELRVYPSPQGLTIYFRDVSERHRAHEEILRLNAQLEQRVQERTEQLEAANRELAAFSYSVAHDLRAPLAAIDGFGHALAHDLAENTSPRIRHYLDRIRVGTRQTHDMIDALLSLSQLSRTELQWQTVNLAPMARMVLDACRQQAPARKAAVQVQQDMAARGDPRLLQLVMDNLVGNAWKFTGNQARTEITVGSKAALDGQTVYFVQDNGAGFDMAYADKLFGAFQRLHSQQEFPGTGIGLANVLRIVSRHGGRIWAHSALGRGAAFYFTLGPQAR
jgi:PAS domain S-box-containing protein